MLRKIIVLGLVLIYSGVKSQTLNYTNILCGSIDPRILITDDFGNFYVAGNIGQSIDFDPSPAIGPIGVNFTNNVTMYLAKYNPAGVYLWGFPLEISDDQSINCAPLALAVDDAGYIYLAGSFGDGVDMDPGPGIHMIYTGVQPPTLAYFIAKYNATGQLVHAYSTSNDIVISDFVLDDYANLYLTGTTNGVDVDPGPNVVSVSVQGQKDLCLLKLDSTLIFQSVRLFNASSESFETKIARDNDKNFIIAGTLALNIDFDPDLGVYFVPGAAPYISKYDSTGNFLWIKSFNHTNHIYKIQTDSQNNIYFAGSFLGINKDFDPDTTSVFNLSSAGQEDSYLAKYSPLGDLLWAFSHGGPLGDGCFDIDLDPSGNCFMSGIYMTDSIDFDPSLDTLYLPLFDPTNHSNYTAVYNSSGQLIKAFGINGSDVGYNTYSQNALTPSGELILAGGFSSNVDFDPGPAVVTAGGCSLGGYITKYGTQFLGTNELASSIFNFNIYPNPLDEVITISIENDFRQLLEISISDIHGRKFSSLYEGIYPGGEMNFDLSSLPAGIYLVSIQTDTCQEIRKLIII